MIIRLIYFLLFTFTSITIAQTKGITYQAVLYDPKYTSTTLPGPDNGLIPYANKEVCLKFEITDLNSQKIYIETQNTTTDAFGIVNLIIGKGTRIGGLVNSFELIDWNNQASGLIVSIDKTANCFDFTQVSNQPFTATPFSLGNTNIKTEIFEFITNKSTDVTTDATSHTKYPSVKAIKDYVDGVSATGAIDATTITKGKIQLSGDLAGTATSPTIAKLQSIPLSKNTPLQNQVLQYDGVSWSPATISVSTFSESFMASASTSKTRDFLLTYTPITKPQFFVNGIRIVSNAISYSGNNLTYSASLNDDYLINEGDTIEIQYTH